MATDIGVEPEDLVGVAQGLLGVSADQFDALTEARSKLYIDHGTFGRLSVCAEVAQTHQAVVEEAGRAVEAMAAVLEGESDALMQSAFAYQAQEEASSDEFESVFTEGP